MNDRILSEDDIVEKRIGYCLHSDDSLTKRLLWAMLATVCFSLLANGYSYFNFYPIHDAVDFTVGGPSGRWQVELGRFLIPVYMRFKGPISMPWLTGVLSMLYLGLSVFTVSELLGQTSRLGIVLVSGFLSVNLFTLEANTSQQYFSDVFLFALLFACLGMYCVWKGSGWKSVAAAAGCMFVSFGTYQAFITFAACLCMLAVMRELVQGEGLTRPVLRRALLCVGVMAVSGAAYLAVSRLVLFAIRSEPSDVAWSIYTIDEHDAVDLWKSIRKNYVTFFRIFFDGRGYAGGLFGIATGLLATMAAVLAVRVLRRRRLALLLVAAMLAVFPLVSRLVNIFTGIDGAFRTMYAQFLIWPMLVSMILWGLPENARRRMATVAVAAVLSAVIIVGNIRYNNGAFIVQRILNERAIYHTGRILEDLEPYLDTKKVAVVGVLNVQSPDEEYLQRYSHINGFKRSTGADSQLAFVRYASLLGYTLDWDPEYSTEVRKLPEVKAMPPYPNPGYIMELDDFIVVKLNGKKSKSAG